MPRRSAQCPPTPALPRRPPIRRRQALVTVLAVALGLLATVAALPVAALELADQRFEFHHEEATLQIPVAANRPIHRPDPAIERLVILVHGLNSNAVGYFATTRRAAVVARREDTTLIVAPQFIQQSRLGDQRAFLHWSVSPFWGSWRGINGAADPPEPVRVSAFDALDRLLEATTDPSRFPNLRHVVVAGHSAGGQMIARYAAANRFDRPGRKPASIELSYLVMAPSSCLYFDRHRPSTAAPGDQRRDRRGRDRSNGDGDSEHEPARFIVPDDPPESYNRYGYGLDDLHGYLRQTGAEVMREQFARRRVDYLVGALDNDNDGANLANGPAAMWQGRNRLERLQHYHAYLAFHFGPEIHRRHRLTIVPEAGHRSADLILSTAGLNLLFDAAIGSE